jgi:DNA-binding NarL/FixJ family response regulator
MSVSILLVDDHPMIRQGLNKLISEVPEFQIAGEAADGVEAIQKIGMIKPDVLIIDMMMPNLNGLEVLLQVTKLSPYTRTIVFSMQSAESYVTKALQYGAHGYILKDAGPGELITAIKTVLQGRRYLSEALSTRFESGNMNDGNAPMDLYQTLTTREREVLQMTAEGKSSTEIGRKLQISSRTVEAHRSNFMKKLGLGNHADLIRYALKHGILPMEE